MFRYAHFIRVFIAAVFAVAIVGGLTAAAAPGPPGRAAVPIFRDTRYSFAERAADLVSRMTLAEKVQQLHTNNAPAIPRLGVQQYTYWSEGQHGINTLGADSNNGNTPGGVHATSFPTNFAATMSWDPQLVYQETTAISDEARGFLDKSLWGTGQNNLGPSASDYGSLTFWAPNVNLDRDPRWGRTNEAFGEDPYLVGQMAGAYVNGYQGQSMAGKPLTGYLKVAATAKHYALNNVENSRHSGSSNTTDANIRDYYTAQFRRLIENSHVSGLMTSYNAINGTPAPADTYTANELAQRTYGFAGYTTSDCGAVGDVYSSGGHNWAPPGWTTSSSGGATTWTSATTGQHVDGAAGGQAYATRAGTDLNCTGGEYTLAYVQQAIKAGILSEGVVDNALVHLFTIRMETGEFDSADNVPYTKITKAVIQSKAHQALAEKVAANSIVLLKNDNIAGTGTPLLPASAAKLNKVVVVGDLADKVTLGGYTGEPSLQVSAVQGITAAVKAGNPAATVTFDSCGTSTSATGPAACSTATRAAIKTADLVIVFTGSDLSVADESHDRSGLAMPGNYTSLISQVSALGNPRTALVIQSDGPVDIAGVQAAFPAIVFSGYNGESQGTALAEVLTGRQNPSGHLDFTWYKDDSQLPAMDDYGLTPAETGGLGRTYQYFTGAPTYPFGYGLSYTSYKYSNVKVTPKHVTADGSVQVGFDVTNTGSTAGATVAQVYAAQNFSVPGVQLPGKRLVGFQKTQVLAPGKTQHITLTTHVSDLSQWNEKALKQTVYPGSYDFRVGPDSANVAGSGTVDVSGAITPHVQYVTVQPDSAVFKPGDTLDLAGKNPWIAADTNPSLEQPHQAADNVVEAVNSDQSFADLSHAKVSYASSNPRVATVTPAGKVSMIAAGAATIRVTVNGVTGSTPVVVRQPLTATAAADMSPGSTAAATTTFTNAGTEPLTDVRLTLSGPSGWTTTPVSPASFASIPAGATVRTTWNVTVPAATSPGGYELAADATFHGGSGQGSSSTEATTFVPGTLSVTLGQQNHGSGLSQVEAGSPGDGATQPVTVGGLEGREAVPTTPPHPNDLNMYFNIDDSIAFAGNYTATFTIQYYDQGTGSFLPQYDSTNPQGGPLSGAYTPGPAIQGTGTNTWKTTSFTVHDGLFGNRENNATDFRITSPSPFIIHSVTVAISANG